MAFSWQLLSADLRQRYEHTYVFVTKSSGEDELFYMERITESDSKPTLHLRNNVSGTIVLNYDTSCDISFRFPETGFFQLGYEALIFQRFSARRYKKGISSDNSEIYAPYDLFEKRKHAIDEDSINAAFQRKFPTFREAVGFLDSGKGICLPLSRYLAIGLSPHAGIQDKVVWYLETPIAAYRENRVEIKEQHFKQEVLDYFRGAMVNAEII